uniref:Late endosomal/lysosomal adaptor and MAPK and MTOR activator 5 n=1 Tax=Arion vulgaris TaxID=1028688 RepID=A0A0B7A4B9_9EUPU
MEKALEKEMDEVCHLSEVSGIICVDSNGLCLGAKGNIPQQCSGYLSALATQAAKLSQNGSAVDPVICLETEHGSLLVKKADNMTTAIFKSS